MKLTSSSLAVAHFSRQQADCMEKIGRQNFEKLAAFAHDCEFERSHLLRVALTPTPSMTLTGDEIRRELNSPLYWGGTFVPDAGILNPIKIADRLRGDVTLYKRSPVTRITGSRVETAGGTVTARRIVLATNAYTHHLFASLLRYFIPLYDYTF